jgi:putative redox protein
VSLGACVAAFVAHYCEQQGIDTRELTVETAYEKTDKPAFLTDFRVDVRPPHAECGDRHAAVERVADHCIIHETLHHRKDLEISTLDRKDLLDA